MKEFVETEQIVLLQYGTVISSHWRFFFCHYIYIFKIFAAVYKNNLKLLVKDYTLEIKVCHLITQNKAELQPK